MFGSKRGALAIVAALSILLAACGQAPATLAPAPTVAPAATTAPAPAAEAAGGEVTVTHAQGETTVAVNPATVVVFDMSILDALDQLGVPVAGLPKSNIPPFLEQYASDDYPNTGTIFEPDYEAVNALSPDLIIVAGRSSTVYPELARIAPTIDLTGGEDFLGSFRQNMTILGQIFAKEEEVAERLAAIDESIARVNGLAAASGKKALIVLTSGGEVTAYGPGSRFGIIHDELGVAPVEEDIEAATHGDAISFEFIAEHNPDILYVVDRDAVTGEAGAAAAEVLDNELVNGTSAAQNGKIVYLDPFVWYLANAGLSTVPAMIEAVEGSLE